MTRGDYIGTYRGGKFHPLDPRPEEVFIEDIAGSLAKLNRYGGHTRYFYPVAEHSVLVSEHVPPEFALEGLLHDAGEAYVGDMVRPLKNSPSMAPFRQIEQRIRSVVYIALGVTSTNESFLAVDRIDRRIVSDEKRALMRGWRDWAQDDGEPLGARIVGLSPERAEAVFMARYLELTGRSA